MEQPSTVPIRYQTFLFCMWEEKVNLPIGHSSWRFRLENPQTGQRIGFKDLEKLMAYLQQKIEAE